MRKVYATEFISLDEFLSLFKTRFDLDFQNAITSVKNEINFKLT